MYLMFRSFILTNQIFPSLCFCPGDSLSCMLGVLDALFGVYQGVVVR
jgi:hypothetical protein